MLNYRYFTRKLLNVKGIIIIVRRAGTHPGIFLSKARYRQSRSGERTVQNRLRLHPGLPLGPYGKEKPSGRNSR
jgi:hypothetical protein